MGGFVDDLTQDVVADDVGGWVEGDSFVDRPDAERMGFRARVGAVRDELRVAGVAAKAVEIALVNDMILAREFCECDSISDSIEVLPYETAVVAPPLMAVHSSVPEQKWVTELLGSHKAVACREYRSVPAPALTRRTQQPRRKRGPGSCAPWPGQGSHPGWAVDAATGRPSQAQETSDAP